MSKTGEPLPPGIAGHNVERRFEVWKVAEKFKRDEDGEGTKNKGIPVASFASVVAHPAQSTSPSTHSQIDVGQGSDPPRNSNHSESKHGPDPLHRDRQPPGKGQYLQAHTDIKERIPQEPHTRRTNESIHGARELMNSRYREERDVACHKLAEREKGKQMISDTLHSTVQKLGNVERRNRELESQVRRLTEEHRFMEQEKRKTSDNLHRTAHKLEEAERRYREAEATVRSLGDSKNIVEKQLQKAEAQHVEMARLLGESRAELRGVNSFLTKADAISGADVIRMVDSLNEEIMQVSAFMADSLDSKDHQRGDEMHLDEERRIQVVGVFGEPMIRFLRHRRSPTRNDPDPTSVQIALQVFFAGFCAHIIEAWCPGNQEVDDILRPLYSAIKRREEPSVSRRWRAIVRSQLNCQDLQLPVLSEIRNWIESISLTAGWPQQKLQELLDKVQERMETVVNMSFRLYRAFGEDVASGEMKAVVVRTDTTFDPDAMNDAFPDDGKADDEGSEGEERVAGTTDIGLQLRSVSGEVTVLKKPTVVRCSTLDWMVVDL